MLFLEHAPNTAMIMGAALSGGDAMGLARRLNDAQTNNSRDSTHRNGENQVRRQLHGGSNPGAGRDDREGGQPDTRPSG